MSSSRTLVWSGCLNVRDLGSLPTPAGLTPPRVFIRADDLTQLTAAGLAALVAYAPSTILDLRRPSEATFLPPLPALALLYHHIPLLDDSPALFSSHDAVYDFIVRSRASFLVQYCAFLAVAPTPIVFHCLHGKDRTGILAALLLNLAGVADSDILADYTLSDSYLASLRATLLESLPSDQHSRLLDDFACPPWRLRLVLDYWQSQGGAANYLLNAGLSSTLLAALQSLLAPISSSLLPDLP
jgi:hypothetical protein